MRNFRGIPRISFNPNWTPNSKTKPNSNQSKLQTLISTEDSHVSVELILLTLSQISTFWFFPLHPKSYTHCQTPFKFCQTTYKFCQLLNIRLQLNSNVTNYCVTIYNK